MSGRPNKASTRRWHQGFGITKDAQSRDCIRFQTYGIAMKVLERAAGNGFRLAIYEDGGDWCLRLADKTDPII